MLLQSRHTRACVSREGPVEHDKYVPLCLLSPLSLWKKLINLRSKTSIKNNHVVSLRVFDYNRFPQNRRVRNTLDISRRKQIFYNALVYCIIFIARFFTVQRYRLYSHKYRKYSRGTFSRLNSKPVKNVFAYRE